MVREKVKRYYLNKRFYFPFVLLGVLMAGVLGFMGYNFFEAYLENNLDQLSRYERLGWTSVFLVPAVLYFILPPLFITKEALRFDANGIHIREGALMKSLNWNEIVSIEIADMHPTKNFQPSFSKNCIRIEHNRENKPSPYWIVPKKYKKTKEELLADLATFIKF